MAVVLKGNVVLRTMSATGKKLATVPLEGTQQVLNMAYSADGKQLVMSLVRGGKSDIYLVGQSGRGPTQLTNDLYDDRHPAFMGSTGRVVFSSNRPTESAAADKGTFAALADNYDLFLYDPAATGSKLRQLTNAVTNELRPQPLDDENLLYLSEESGVRALHRLSLTEGGQGQVSDFLLNLKTFGYSPAGNKLAFVSSFEGREGVYYYPAYTLENRPAAKTRRMEILEARLAPAPAAPDQAAGKSGTGSAADSTAAQPRSNQVDINNYSFENEPKRAAKRKAQAGRAGLANQPLVLIGPKESQARFSIKNFVSSFYIDPYFGLGFVGEVGMTDMFENHRIYGGVFFLTDFRTSNFYGEYQNLKNRYDIRVAYDRKSLFFATENGNLLRFVKHEVMPQISYPLTYTTSVRFSPRFMNVRYTAVNNFPAPDQVTNFTGATAEVVYDNSTTTGINQREGTRARFGVQGNLGMGKSYENFGKLYLDARHYQKIHRQIIWANRVSYGHYFGPAAKSFLIGGMDNWIGRNLDGNLPLSVPPNSNPADFFYLDFVTPMRGFNYNARNGQKYVLLNSELRFPIVQYLVRGPVYSGFFRNLQLTAFTDAGTAYNGVSPFNVNNSFNTQVVGGDGNSFTATVTNYRNPFLVGYGLGMRTMMLGMYAKLDVAWGRRDYLESGPKFYVTLGYDF